MCFFGIIKGTPHAAPGFAWQEQGERRAQRPGHEEMKWGVLGHSFPNHFIYFIEIVRTILRDMFVTLEGFLCPIVCFLACTFDPMQVASKPVPKSTQPAPAAQEASYWNFMRFWRNMWKVRKTGASKHSFFKRSSLHKNVFFWHHKGDPTCSSRLQTTRHWICWVSK